MTQSYIIFLLQFHPLVSFLFLEKEREWKQEKRISSHHAPLRIASFAEKPSWLEEESGSVVVVVVH